MFGYAYIDIEHIPHDTDTMPARGVLIPDREIRCVNSYL